MVPPVSVESIVPLSLVLEGVSSQTAAGRCEESLGKLVRVERIMTVDRLILWLVILGVLVVNPRLAWAQQEPVYAVYDDVLFINNIFDNEKQRSCPDNLETC